MEIVRYHIQCTDPGTPASPSSCMQNMIDRANILSAGAGGAKIMMNMWTEPATQSNPTNPANIKASVNPAAQAAWLQDWNGKYPGKVVAEEWVNEPHGKGWFDNKQSIEQWLAAVQKPFNDALHAKLPSVNVMGMAWAGAGTGAAAASGVEGGANYREIIPSFIDNPAGHPNVPGHLDVLSLHNYGQRTCHDPPYPTPYSKYWDPGYDYHPIPAKAVDQAKMNHYFYMPPASAFNSDDVFSTYLCKMGYQAMYTKYRQMLDDSGGGGPTGTKP